MGLVYVKLRTIYGVLIHWMIMTGQRAAPLNLLLLVKVETSPLIWT